MTPQSAGTFFRAAPPVRPGPRFSCLRSGSAAGRKPAGFTPEPNRSVNTREEFWESPNASVYRARPEVSRVHSLKTRIDADLEPFCEPTVNSEDKPGNCCCVNDHYTAYKPAQAAAADAPSTQKSARELFLSLFTPGLRRLGRSFSSPSVFALFRSSVDRRAHLQGVTGAWLIDRHFHRTLSRWAQRLKSLISLMIND